jgi:hypothetical protein
MGTEYPDLDPGNHALVLTACGSNGGNGTAGNQAQASPQEIVSAAYALDLDKATNSSPQAKQPLPSLSSNWARTRCPRRPGSTIRGAY